MEEVREGIARSLGKVGESADEGDGAPGDQILGFPKEDYDRMSAGDGLDSGSYVVGGCI